MRFIALLLFILFSCSVPDKASLKVSNETRGWRKSPVILKAELRKGATYDVLELRENNSFSYRSLILGTQKISIYAGTYQRQGDSLSLNFHNNHKDASWTGKALMEKGGDWITIFSYNDTDNKRLFITELK